MVVARQARALRLTWTAPATTGGSPVTDYLIQVSTDGLTWGTVGDGVRTATGGRIVGLDRSTDYVVRIVAVSDVGTGAWVATATSTR